MSIGSIVDSGKMYGSDAPFVNVLSSGLAGGLGTPSGLVLQGDATINPIAMSRWEQATSKGYMCCFLNASKQLVTGYSADLDFLTDDNAISSKTTQAGITTQLVGSSNLDIARLSDGTALLVILDQRNDGAGYYSILKCYESTSGDGGDWSLLSTIHTSAVKASVFSDASEAHIVVAPSGDLFVSANAYNDYSTAVYTAGKIFKSDDDGATWTEELSVGSITGRSRGISQVAFMPDRFWCVLSFPNEANLYKSVDDGDNWTLVEGIKSPTFDAITSTLLQGASMYYESDSDTALCHITDPFDVGEDGGLFSMDNPTTARLNDLNNFDRKSTFASLAASARMYSLGSNLIIHVIQASAQRIYTLEILSGSFDNVKNILVEHMIGQAGYAIVEIDNTDGVYSYDGSAHLNEIGPNTELDIDMGYGTISERVFKGIVDKTTAKSFPQSLIIKARDDSKLAIDGTIIRPTDGFRTFTITSTTPEAVFTTLAGWAGYTDINTDVSGVSIDAITFDWENYVDVFGRLCDMTAFDWWVDTTGAIFFRERAANEPRVTDEPHTLVVDGSDWSTTLDNIPILSASDVITNVAGTVTYIRDTDYTLNLATGKLTSIVGGALASGGNILADYTHPRHIFQEGVNMTKFAYGVDDTDLFYKVVAYGINSDGEAIKGEFTQTSQIFGVQTNKLKKLDIEGTMTTTQLENIAEKVATAMRFRVRYADVWAIAVPTVKLGDCVQIIEASSTISEIYRITELSYTYDKQMKMKFRAYFVGYAPIGG